MGSGFGFRATPPPTRTSARRHIYGELAASGGGGETSTRAAVAGERRTALTATSQHTAQVNSGRRSPVINRRQRLALLSVTIVNSLFKKPFEFNELSVCPWVRMSVRMSVAYSVHTYVCSNNIAPAFNNNK